MSKNQRTSIAAATSKRMSKVRVNSKSKPRENVAELRINPENKNLSTEKDTLNNFEQNKA